MTNAEIIAELRRSAMEDLDPWSEVEIETYRQAATWKNGERITLGVAKPDHLRTFFLLVAHALEDEC